MYLYSWKGNFMIFILSLGKDIISCLYGSDSRILRAAPYNTGKLDLNLHLFIYTHISHVSYSTYIYLYVLYIYRYLYKKRINAFFAIKLGKLETINFAFVFISKIMFTRKSLSAYEQLFNGFPLLA